VEQALALEDERFTSNGKQLASYLVDFNQSLFVMSHEKSMGDQAINIGLYSYKLVPVKLPRLTVQDCRTRSPWHRRRHARIRGFEPPPAPPFAQKFAPVRPSAQRREY
jgi:hypothetical protein